MSSLITVLFIIPVYALAFSRLIEMGRAPSLAKLRCKAKFIMQEEIWLGSRVESNVVEAIGLRRIEILADAQVASNYAIPGQFVQIKSSEQGSKPGFYAIASPPDGRNRITFLVKETDNNAFFSTSAVGTSLLMSDVKGKGYQIQSYFNEDYKFDFSATNIILAATGSGLSPIASAIDSAVLGLNQVRYNSLFKRTAKLFLGVKTPKHLPFTDRYADWAALGVEVIPVFSQDPGPAGSTAEWKNAKRGYLQDILRANAKDYLSQPRNTGALLCGQRGMTDSVKELLLEAGVFEGRILLNF